MSHPCVPSPLPRVPSPLPRVPSPLLCSSVGDGFSLHERSLRLPVPPSSRLCLALCRAATDTGVLLLRAPADPLPHGLSGDVPASVARSPLELRPAGRRRRRLLAPEAAGSWLLPPAGRRPGSGHSHGHSGHGASRGTRSGFVGAPAEGAPPACPLGDPWLHVAAVPCAACTFYSYKYFILIFVIMVFILMKTDSYPVLHRLQARGSGKQELGSKGDAVAIPRAVRRAGCLGRLRG